MIEEPYDKFIEKFLKKNPTITEDDLNFRMDGRIEWICEHGIGHTIWHPKGSDFVHGCDSCCKKLKKDNKTLDVIRKKYRGKNA